MADLFRHAKRRVSRAKHNADACSKLIDDYVASKPHARVVELDSDGFESHFIRVTRTVPEEIEDLAIECMDGLRSALDQSIYASAVASGKKEPKHHYFPFAKSAAELEIVIKGRCADVPTAIVEKIRTYKPYLGGNSNLHTLNTLRGSHQHSILTTAGTAGGADLIQINYANHALLVGGPWDREKQEVCFLRCAPSPAPSYSVHFLFNVFFDHPLLTHDSAAGVLQTFISEVDKIVTEIEQECSKLGYI